MGISTPISTGTTIISDIVDSITGTARQILVNGTSGSPQNGVITLTLPQNIDTASGPTFAGLILSGLTPSSLVISSNISNNLISGNLSGDISTSGLVTTLATVNSNVGTFGSSTQVPQFTVNAKGLITAVTDVAISGVSPGGIAGGDLSGNYPNPSVADVGGSTAASIHSAELLANAATSSPIASTILKRDSNANAQINNLIKNIATTVTTAGTTTLTAASAPIQQFTGTTTQTILLPNATTLNNGYPFYIANRSTGAVTIKYNDNSTIAVVVNPGQQIELYLVSNVTTNGIWDISSYIDSITGTANRISVTTINGNTTIDISSSYVGQSTIATLGTITVGIWNGTAINLSSYASGTLQAAQFPALIGDVTTSIASLTTTISNHAVTYAKFQQVAANSLLGNPTGSLTNVTEIGLGTNLVFSGSNLTTSLTPTFSTLTINNGGSAISSTNSVLIFPGSLSDGSYANIGGGGRNLGVFQGGATFLTYNLDYDATNNTYVYNNSINSAAAIELANSTAIALKYAPIGTAGANITPSTGLSLSNTGIVSIPVLTLGSVLFSGAGGAISQNNPNFFWDNTNNNLYIGANTSTTLDAPGRLVLQGTANSVINGSDIIFYNTADSHPLLQILPSQHDGIYLGFDTYWNGTNWISTFSSSNYRIAKLAGNFEIDFSSTTIGNTVSWTTALSITNTGIINAFRLFNIGTTTSSSTGLTIQGPGGITSSTAKMAYFGSVSAATAGNIYLIAVDKSGTDSLLMGINKNTISGGIPANATFISTSANSGQISLGRGNGAGLPNSADLLIDSSGNININNGNVNISALTSGSVLFSGAGGTISQNTSNFFWNNTNFYLGIGINTPTCPLHVEYHGSAGTGALLAAFGNTAVNTRIEFFDETTSLTLGPKIYFNAGNPAQIAGQGSIYFYPGGLSSPILELTNVHVNIPGLPISSLVVTDPFSNLSTTNTLSSTVLGNITKITITNLTSGSGTYTTPANCTHICVRMWGAGGGGGGVAGGLASAGGAGGGGGGGYLEQIITSPSSSYTYSIGTGGTGGPAGANNGSSGTSTTFQSLTAGGGSFGNGIAAGLAANLIVGGVGGTIPAGSYNLFAFGSAGAPGIAYSAVLAQGGRGGSSPSGGGDTISNILSNSGATGQYPGGGGAGAVSTNGASFAGGSGANGQILIEEYYNG